MRCKCGYSRVRPTVARARGHGVVSKCRATIYAARGWKKLYRSTKAKQGRCFGRSVRA